MRHNLWGVGLAAVLALALVACQQNPIPNQPPTDPTLALTVTGINWDAQNNNSAQTYFSVDVRVSSPRPLRNGHTLQPKRFTYTLSDGATASSGYPYLDESSCTPAVFFLTSVCRVHFLFREGLSRAELVPSTIRYNAGMTGSGEVPELP